MKKDTGVLEKIKYIDSRAFERDFCAHGAGFPRSRFIHALGTPDTFL
jgi:hypothetical protein